MREKRGGKRERAACRGETEGCRHTSMVILEATGGNIPLFGRMGHGSVFRKKEIKQIGRAHV